MLDAACRMPCHMSDASDQVSGNDTYQQALTSWAPNSNSSTLTKHLGDTQHIPEAAKGRPRGTQTAPSGSQRCLAGRSLPKSDSERCLAAERLPQGVSER
ncbi:hypothetical protein N9L68_08165 [bacterium]|nr:hypothetical protein [bacterium]